ncbi:MAG: HEAT repeat domain-containing protein [Bradymonadaceae bacterium]|nr:HEAT repeat domain-containing protein [Lujinxingiaceae bacterium]
MKRLTHTLAILLAAATLTVGAVAMAQDDSTLDQASQDRASSDQATKPVHPVTPEQLEQAKAREKVVLLLSGYHHFPSRADLDAVAEAEPLMAVLRALAEDEAVAPSMRLRAVDAMGLYDESAATLYLIARIAPVPESTPSEEARTLGLMRHRAMIALAKSRGVHSIEHLAPLLSDPDLQLRLTAISALGKHGGDSATKLLRALKERDTHHAIQREINKYVP